MSQTRAKADAALSAFVDTLRSGNVAPALRRALARKIARTVPAPKSVIAARQALAAAIREARHTGPITTRYYCEDCLEDHEETHYAPVADAVMQCFPLIDAVAWDRRNGVPIGGRGEQLLELAGTAYSGLGLTDEERTAQMMQALEGIAEALGAPLPAATA